jgi:N-carbamoylputrescine amidase
MVVIGPEGNIIEGVFPDGTKALRYAKSHIPYSARDLTKYNETYYFTPGSGWPTFDTPKAKIGLTLCYDRHFPEPFRILALQGSEIIFNSSVAMAFTAIEGGASMADTYLTELRTHALENTVWICSVNKVGTETLQGQQTYYYGNSSIIDPTGKIRAQLSADKPAVVTSTLDLEDIVATRRNFRYLMARRPHLYGPIVKEDYGLSPRK